MLFAISLKDLKVSGSLFVFLRRSCCLYFCDLLILASEDHYDSLRSLHPVAEFCENVWREKKIIRGPKPVRTAQIGGRSQPTTHGWTNKTFFFECFLSRRRLASAATHGGWPQFANSNWTWRASRSCSAPN